MRPKRGEMIASAFLETMTEAVVWDETRCWAAAPAKSAMRPIEPRAITKVAISTSMSVKPTRWFRV